jgi:hypothetical protein
MFGGRQSRQTEEWDDIGLDAIARLGWPSESDARPGGLGRRCPGRLGNRDPN